MPSSAGLLPLRLPAAVVALVASGLCACTTPCDFEPHCEGNVVMDCVYGVDQIVGSGQPVVYACLEPASACVVGQSRYSGAQRIFCAVSPPTPCDTSFQSYCAGTVLFTCVGGYITAQDCSDQSGTGRCGRDTPDAFLRCL